jgi:integrase
MTWSPEGYVFARADGRPIDPDEATKRFREIVRGAGLPQLTLHGLRHLCATWLLAEGIPLRAVSEMLGHSSPNVTLGIYSHSLPGVAQEAALAMDRRLARGRSPAME